MNDKILITLDEIKADMSPMAIESMNELTDGYIRKWKNRGLMSPELCFIGLRILDQYSDNAKSIINGMKNLDRLMADADELLKSLQP